MATDKRTKDASSSSPPPDAAAGAAATTTSAHATVGAPARDDAGASRDLLVEKMRATQAGTIAVPFNANKSAEYGDVQAPAGVTVDVDPLATSSTVTEATASPKLGTGKPNLGSNPGVLPLDRVRTDATGRVMTTNHGVPVADNQHSLKAGLRGPALLEDFILREKITHFDHERIPERIVHARGSAAHGYFECYQPMTDVTRASLFSESGKRTPVFVRFSTVLGERGSADTPRDVRGFAVKFYTDEGNWDLVGNNIPVFFIQDAIKFPDLIHAGKPEPHFGVPQASTAHDTFWDFISLMPESTHMMMWVMSDRALPRSYRMMQGFGVHTFRLVDGAGKSTFVKFHWRPIAGTHSLDWDESVKIMGADADFHRRDLWEAIEAGAFPEWELSFQMFSEEQADAFSFDVLDATKLVPLELVPLTPVGKMVLNRNPDNFFAETEQVAFCTAHVVPGIDFTNDPLLAGRIHSYIDTQISRLGGPNFHEIPINAPIVQAHNNQRDGMHRQAIHRGAVAYEPNTLGGGCPFQAGSAGFTSFREPIQADKVRGSGEKFAEHYNQATLFYNSQSPIEKAHILRAFRFELTRVRVPAIRERIVASLANVDAELAATLAKQLGMKMPEPMPRAMPTPPDAEVMVSPSLSLFALPGDGGIATRRIAIFVADGIDGATSRALHAKLTELGAVPRYIAAQLGAVTTSEGDTIEAEISFETMPSVLFDAVAVADGPAAAAYLATVGHAVEFLKDQYRHAKPMLVLGAAADLLTKAGIPTALPSGAPDPGLITGPDATGTDTHSAFVGAIGRHRHFERAVDPPLV